MRNQRVVDARKLALRKHRQRQGRFLVEGLQLIHMGLEAGARALEAFYCPKLFSGAEAPALLERLGRAGARSLQVSPKVMRSLCQRDAPQGLVVTFALLEASLSQVLLIDDGLIVILDRLQDPGNLGTLVRTADAVGALAVVLIESCVDPFDPKTVRATMGSLFNLPLVRTRDVSGLFAWLQERGFAPVGADVHSGVLWGQGLWRGRVALVLGNEARGLGGDLRTHVGHWARLPMVGRAESLNVSVAGGVLMYSWLCAHRESSSEMGQ